MRLEEKTRLVNTWTSRYQEVRSDVNGWYGVVHFGDRKVKTIYSNRQCDIIDYALNIVTFQVGRSVGDIEEGK